MRKIDVRIVGSSHDGAVGKTNAQAMRGGSFLEARAGAFEEVACAARVGYSLFWETRGWN